MLKLEKNIIYKNSGNIFSKSLLIGENLEKNNANLIVVQDEKILKNYKKIFDFLGIDINVLDNLSGLVNIFLNKKGNYITTKNFFETEKINFWELENKNSIFFEVGKNISLEKISEKLNNFNYKNNSFIEKATFNKSGDVLNIGDVSLKKEYKINFWGDEIEEIFEIDKTNKNFSFKEKFFGLEEKNSQKNSLNKIEKLFIGENKKIDFFEDLDNKLNLELIEKLNKTNINIFILDIDFYKNSLEIYKLLKNSIIFSSLIFPDFEKKFDKKIIKDLFLEDIFLESLDDFKEILNPSPQPSPLKGEGVVQKKEIIIFTRNKKTIKNFLEYNNIFEIKIIETKLNNLKSFRSPLISIFSEKSGKIGKNKKELVVICDDNISRIFVKKRLKKSIVKELDLLMQIKPDDYIVHYNHGIGIFRGIIQKDLAGIKKEYLEIEYDKKDKLFVPITEISRVNKYVGVENPKLTSLSGAEWTKKLDKAKKDVLVIAGELLEIYAKRKLQKGFSFKSFKQEEIKFSQSFEYNYTPDQQKVIAEIFEDMESHNPMDRLLTGDVGFGKTEVAFNAIYKAILNGKQAVLISPLVVLAYEHYDKAIERFKNFPINIGVLTRFESSSKTKEILKKLEEGKIDLIIGTHKLLNENIKFKDLGLIVIDEEHKFGVEHKEKLKEFRGNIDILSMSATPIPRSLNMALNSLKKISMLTTPPFGRKSVKTFVINYDEKIIYEACKKEFERQGQVFFIHNRVASIESVKIRLEKLFKTKKVIIVHGQLSGDELEKRILAFKRRQYDILLSTTVIENGIDFPNVNTIFINDAYKFGISQIHQLRGRVGRADKQAYCYLFYRKEKLNEIATKRLKTMVEYTHLGAGFELALKDLEIRGGGDILGLKQSGQVSEIGLNLFLQMLEQKVEELKSINLTSSQPSPTGEGVVSREEKIVPAVIDLNIGASIPDEFFSSNLDKINFYRELEVINNLGDLEAIKKDFEIFNKDFPLETKNLFLILKVRLLAGKYNIKLIKKVGINYQLEFDSFGNGENDKNKEIEILKKFLDLDKQVKFVVFNTKILRSSVKKYKGDLDFLEYLEKIFTHKNPKILKIKKT